MACTIADLPALLSLLTKMVNRDEVDKLLHQAGAPYSASNWSTFVDSRLKPAIESAKITIDQLADLLRETEEHGRQHVLLFRAHKGSVAEYLQEPRVKDGLKRLGSPSILDSPRVLDRPTDPTFTEARIERTPKGQPKALVIKRVRTREYHELVSEERVDHYINVRYKVEETRAVDLVKLHADGLCEVRLQSHKKPHYAHEAGQLLLALSDLLPTRALDPYVLVKAKNYLVNCRQKLAGEVRYTASTLKNSQGYTIQAAAGTEAGNLFDNEGMALSLKDFLSYDGYCDGSNVWFRVGEKPNKEPNWVHVLISGQPNEFALTAQCGVREYDHVLARLREFNR